MTLFWWWHGAVRQQAITWANADPHLCHHRASLRCNELNHHRFLRGWGASNYGPMFHEFLKQKLRKCAKTRAIFSQKCLIRQFPSLLSYRTANRLFHIYILYFWLNPLHIFLFKFIQTYVWDSPKWVNQIITDFHTRLGIATVNAMAVDMTRFANHYSYLSATN